MAFRIKRNESVGDAVRRIADEQIGKAIAEVDDRALGCHETVHQVRKRCKKIRGLIRLVRPAFEKTYRRENGWYRDAAHTLSHVRDTQSSVETFDALIEQYHQGIEQDVFDSVRHALVQRRREVAADKVGIDERLAAFREQMQKGRKRLPGWFIDDEGFDAVAAGLSKTYRRGRKAMRKAHRDPAAENFHTWRKRVKYHWYHARLVRSIWKPVVGAHRDAANELSDILGDEHDLTVFGQTLLADPASFGGRQKVVSLMALVDRRRVELRAEAQRLGHLLLAEKPKHLRRRFHIYWDAWRNGSDASRVELDTHAAVGA